jgi:hypothetical protein
MNITKNNIGFVWIIAFVIGCVSNKPLKSFNEKFDFEKEMDFASLSSELFHPHKDEIEKIEKNNNYYDLILYKTVSGKPHLNSMLVISIDSSYLVRVKELKSNLVTKQFELNDKTIRFKLDSINNSKSYIEQLVKFDGPDYMILLYKDGIQFSNIVSNDLKVNSKSKSVNIIKSVVVNTYKNFR